VPAAEYLSGHVRAKLVEARAALEDEPKFAANVEALTAVLPPDRGPDRITPLLGAAWIDVSYVEQFLQETLEDSSVRVEHPGATLWTVTADEGRSVLATTRWGTDRYSAVELAQDILEQRPIQVYDTIEVVEDGARKERRVLNSDATVAAAEKAAELKERFSAWAWEDPARATALCAAYNEKLNGYVLRSYDGVKLSLPGLASTFQPRAHQLAAVARIVHEPSVGLFHAVGAGKTSEMIMGAMELGRLGLITKPAVVVPNHMLEQFANEWQQLYPQAKLLATTKDDLSRERRQAFAAKCATNHWDAVIMTRSAFERLPLSFEAQSAYIHRALAEIQTMVDYKPPRGTSRRTVKRVQNMRLKATQRVEAELKKLDKEKDVGVTFEQCGIDYLFIDEAHGYKNLMTFSNIPGMAIEGARRSSDLHMKIEHLRTRSSRVCTLATATPIANSIGEVYTMLRYLRPDLLEDVGIRGFDAWAATFGETVTFFEVAPDGSGMRMQSRFARFKNAPELLRMFAVAGDFKSAEDLKLPTPELVQRVGDQQRAAEVVVVPPSTELRAFMEDIAERADAIRKRQVRPKVDNMLRISTDGRMAALDLRMVGLSTVEPTKLDIAAERIAGTFERFRDARYHGADGELHPRPGALQLVFADIGTPRVGQWSVYEELRSLLERKGIPREAVRFIQEAKDDQAKAKLFAACREGAVSVLVGSTEGMGVGTNVQKRAIALHHLDCPWRPADLAQREGRIVRQGNENPEVEILRYVTERSFDAYTWQTVARKAESFNAMLSGRVDAMEEIEELGDSVLSLNEAKALATGNPLLLEHAQVQAEVTRLERLERSHRQAQDMISSKRFQCVEQVGQLQRTIGLADAAMARDTGPAGEHGTVLTVRGVGFAKRADADDRLREVIDESLQRRRGGAGGPPIEVGNMRGFVVTVQPHWATRSATLALEGVPNGEVLLGPEDIPKAALTVRLENRLAALPKLKQDCGLDLKRVQMEAERAEDEIGKPFRHAEALASARTEFAVLNEQLAESAMAPEVEAAEARSATARDPSLKGLIAHLQQEFALPVRPMPEGHVAGELVYMQVADDGRVHAAVRVDETLHVIVAECDASTLSEGQSVELTKQDGQVQIGVQGLAAPVHEARRALDCELGH
jgi:hypothetical protein